MAMSQTDTANLINDLTFRGRVKVAALADTSARKGRRAW